MAKSSKEGREELTLRVQAALSTATKKEAECLMNVFVSCMEGTLIEHLAEDGFCLMLTGFGKFIVRHRAAKSRKIGFSGETREVPPKRKVKFVSLGKLRQLGSVTSSDGVS